MTSTAATTDTEERLAGRWMEDGTYLAGSGLLIVQPAMFDGMTTAQRGEMTNFFDGYAAGMKTMLAVLRPSALADCAGASTAQDSGFPTE